MIAAARGGPRRTTVAVRDDRIGRVAAAIPHVEAAWEAMRREIADLKECLRAEELRQFRKVLDHWRCDECGAIDHGGSPRTCPHCGGGPCVEYPL